MIMSYFKKPTTINLTYPNADISSVNLNWNNIICHIDSKSWGDANSYPIEGAYDSCNNISLAIHANIGRICRQLGHLAGSTYTTGSNYDNSETSTTAVGIRNALISLGYTVSAVSNYTNGDLWAPFIQKKLIIMFGENPTKGTAHAWTVDGCKYYQTKLYEYIQNEETGIWELFPTGGVTTTRMNHINWGQCGRDNGYFSDGVFNQKSHLFLDSGSDSSTDQTNNYTNIKYIAIGHD